LLLAIAVVVPGCDEPTGPEPLGVQPGDVLAFSHVGAIDQQQTESGSPGYSCPIGVAGRMAQGVTPQAGAWAQVSLLMIGTIDSEGNPYSETITLDIRDGSPTGPLLGTATAAVPFHESWVDFHFDPSVALTPGSLVYLDLDIRWYAYWSRADGTLIANCSGEFELPDEDFNFITYAPIASPADSDGDGLPDAQDPDVVADIVADLSDSAFRAPGHRTAIASHLEEAEAQILAGDLLAARHTLENLRRHFDGCELGAAADHDDWIVDCTAQAEVRTAVDALLAALSA
jgi:hypothetical protein